MRAELARTSRVWHLDFPFRYWYPWKTGVDTNTHARFSAAAAEPQPPGARSSGTMSDLPFWLGLREAKVEESGGMRMATDDWPFLYTRQPTVPGLTLRGIALTLVLSVLLWFGFGGNRALATESGIKPEWGAMARSFFLGAGFMLVETKAVVQMALLFGGTWMVNTVVFAAILVMSLLGQPVRWSREPQTARTLLPGAVRGAGDWAGDSAGRVPRPETRRCRSSVCARSCSRRSRSRV